MNLDPFFIKNMNRCMWKMGNLKTTSLCRLWLTCSLYWTLGHTVTNWEDWQAEREPHHVRVIPAPRPGRGDHGVLVQGRPLCDGLDAAPGVVDVGVVTPLVTRLPDRRVVGLEGTEESRGLHTIAHWDSVITSRDSVITCALCWVTRLKSSSPCGKPIHTMATRRSRRCCFQWRSGLLTCSCSLEQKNQTLLFQWLSILRSASVLLCCSSWWKGITLKHF